MGARLTAPAVATPDDAIEKKRERNREAQRKHREAMGPEKQAEETRKRRERRHAQKQRASKS